MNRLVCIAKLGPTTQLALVHCQVQSIASSAPFPPALRVNWRVERCPGAERRTADSALSVRSGPSQRSHRDQRELATCSAAVFSPHDEPVTTRPATTSKDFRATLVVAGGSTCDFPAADVYMCVNGVAPLAVNRREQ